jgi:uncharacterized protein
VLDGATRPLYSLAVMIAEASETLTTCDGITLQARVAAPPAPRGAMVLCHPHPLYGGDMDNPVVVRLAEVANDLGLGTVRFNFRGTGGSTGAHGQGVAEQDDVEAALARLLPLAGAGPRILAGYSFGAAVGAAVAARHHDLQGVVLVAPPLARLDSGGFAGLQAFGDRVLVAAGSNDEICPMDRVASLRATLPKAAFHAVDGANHFFFGKLFPLGEAVAGWLRQTVLA